MRAIPGVQPVFVIMRAFFRQDSLHTAGFLTGPKQISLVFQKLWAALIRKIAAHRS